MLARTCAALLLIFMACGCSLTPSARLDGHAWLLQTTGKVSGADLENDLGYRGTSPQLDLEGAAAIGRSSITADWAHLHRDANGEVTRGFAFAGVPVATQTNIASHTDADLVTAFYGFRIGPRIISITPGIGGAYARYDVTASGVTNTPSLLGVSVGTPFTAESHANQPFPIGALQMESVPLGWLDLIARVDGFGIPQGQMIDGQGLVRVRFEHLSVDAGYRYIRLNAGDTRINIKGAMVGAGVYF
jgi:hypothetical protein